MDIIVSQAEHVSYCQHMHDIECRNLDRAANKLHSQVGPYLDYVYEDSFTSQHDKKKTCIVEDARNGVWVPEWINNHVSNNVILT